MTWILTDEAKTFLEKLEEALELPNKGKHWHPALEMSIKEFRLYDSVISNYEIEVCRIQEMLGRYADVNITKNQETSNVFRNLYQELTELFLKLNFVKNHGISVTLSKKETSHDPRKHSSNYCN